MCVCVCVCVCVFCVCFVCVLCVFCVCVCVFCVLCFVCARVVQSGVENGQLLLPTLHAWADGSMFFCTCAPLNVCIASIHMHLARVCVSRPSSSEQAHAAPIRLRISSPVILLRSSLLLTTAPATPNAARLRSSPPHEMSRVHDACDVVIVSPRRCGPPCGAVHQFRVYLGLTMTAETPSPFWKPAKSSAILVCGTPSVV